MKADRRLLGSLVFYLEDGVFLCEPKIEGRGISSGFYIDESIPFQTIVSAEKAIGGRLVMELLNLLLYSDLRLSDIVTLNKEGF